MQERKCDRKKERERDADKAREKEGARARERERERERKIHVAMVSGCHKIVNCNVAEERTDIL